MWIAMVLLLAGPGPSADASQVVDFEVRDVSLDSLLSLPESYVGKSVRTRGELDAVSSRRARRGLVYALRGTFGGRLVINTMPEATEAWEGQAPGWTSREVEVTGLVSTPPPPVRRTWMVRRV